MSPEEFARMSAAAEGNASVAARERRVFLRQLHSRAQHGLADKQGRLVCRKNLPQDRIKVKSRSWAGGAV